MCKNKILIAGFGSYYNGDDLLGIVVADELRKRLMNRCVKIVNIVSNGIEFIHQLMSDNFNLVIIIDTIVKNSSAGTMHIIELGPKDIVDYEKIDEISYLHKLDPGLTLVIAKSLNILPNKVVMIGCEPKNLNSLEMSAEVIECRKRVIEEIETLIKNYL
ncbi:hydrogenase maturation protease [Sulfolobus islandicus]|uniref:Hydrogenase maturation protease n=1 Tax=Saccharolobus islandicus (strain HVE10/4) TaxID=930943 RepID=F0NP63_SACI0|nr:hydrogenase maturation protease [Sulfolobus islandicus]ADX82249.1 hypothetical protein SiH_0896 [Sulfolobus islandicus HVE10/4]WCM36437.1 hydrogenase maturation protease [Sulfolobus islandicus]